MGGVMHLMLIVTPEMASHVSAISLYHPSYLVNEHSPIAGIAPDRQPGRLLVTL